MQSATCPAGLTGPCPLCLLLIHDPLTPAGLARNGRLMPSYSRARRVATGRFGYGEPPGVCLAPGYSISVPCPRGLLVPPGVRLGRTRLTLESVTGPGSLHNGSRPRGPRVRPQPAPGPGPRGTCRTAPCPAQTRAPGRACDDPWHFVGPPRAGGPHPSLVQRPGAGTP